MARRPHRETVNAGAAAARKAAVARLRVRGKSLGQIVEALSTDGVVNPQTGKPWCERIIVKDLDELKREWRADASRDIKEHLSEVLSEVRAVHGAAWENGDLRVALLSLERLAKLLGLDGAQKVELTGAGGGPVAVEVKPDLSKLSDEQLRAWLEIQHALKSG